MNYDIIIMIFLYKGRGSGSVFDHKEKTDPVRIRPSKNHPDLDFDPT